MSDIKKALVIFEEKEIQETISAVLEELKYKAVMANNSNEARLKFSNEPFKLIILDHDLKGFNGAEYLEAIRRKESAKNHKNLIPAVAVCEQASDFTGNYSQLDNIKFLERPFKPLDLKKALLSFTGNSGVIQENTKKISEGEYLINEGGSNHEMFWVLEGTLQITKLNHDENNIILGEIKAGELVGEMSFLDNLPRSASVRALTDCEVLVIPHKKFIDVLEGQPRWFRSLMQTMSQRLRVANDKIAKKYVKAGLDDSKAEE